MKIYDTASQSRITFIDRPADSPRADLFKCALHWQDDSTLLISWADHIKIARIRSRPVAQGGPPLLVEITAVFQLDCMVAGILPHPTPPSSTLQNPSPFDDVIPSNGAVNVGSAPSKASSLTLSSLLVLAYNPPDTSFLHGNEMTEDRIQQKRVAAERPELRIISRAGEELAADALSLTDFQLWGCNDYVLAEVDDGSGSGVEGEGRCYVVMSPRDIVIVKPRDDRDHVEWLVERKKYEEALEAVEKIGQDDIHARVDSGDGINATEIGQRYIQHLVSEGKPFAPPSAFDCTNRCTGDFLKAARLCPKVCAQDSKRWEDWIFVFAQQKQLNVCSFSSTRACSNFFSDKL